MAEPIVLDGLLAKVESSYGTDPTPTVAANGVRLADRVWSTLRPVFHYPNTRDDVASGSLTPAPDGVPQGRMVELDLFVEAKGFGAAYSATDLPEVDPLLYACGLGRAVVTTGGSETVTYSLADTSHGSATVWAYAGGQQFKVVGCRGNLVWEINAGQLARFRFRLMGRVTSVADTALPAITYSSVSSPAAVGVGLSIDPGTPWSPNFVSATLDLGNQTEIAEDGNATTGIEGWDIVRRDPRFTVTARKAALSAYNPYTLAAAKTSHTIDLAVGSTQYERFDLDVNAARLAEDPGPVDDNGRAAWELVYRLQDCAIVFD